MRMSFSFSVSSKQKGFTLIELLVVIAIIGILSSVVLASLSTARAKSRDAKRVAEVGQISKALELYYDANQTYPSTTPTGYAGADAGVQLLAATGVLPKTPIPPSGTNFTYIYHGLYKDDAGVVTECTVDPVCNSFELGITLERVDNVVLTSDADQSVGTFYGTNPDCEVVTAGTETCFDVAP
jgi:prepilin-type N-terminal cleavage/methylation domain-containing protein